MYLQTFSFGRLISLAMFYFVFYISPMVSPPFHRAARRRAAFSLVEMLTVMALIVTLASITAPVTRFFSASSEKSMSDLATLFEMARAEAMARSTYVWMGIDITQGESTDTYRTYTAVFASQDGTEDASAANVRQISKTQYFPNIRLSVPVASGVTDRFELGPDRRTVLDFRSVGKSARNFRNVIQINPSGEISLPPETAGASPVDVAVARSINLNLLPNRGSRDVAELSSQLRISTLTGNVQLIRR